MSNTTTGMINKVVHMVIDVISMTIAIPWKQLRMKLWLMLKSYLLNWDSNCESFFD